MLDDAIATPPAYEWQENGTATLKTPVPFPVAILPHFFNVPPPILATFHPGIVACINRLKQVTLRRGETTHITLPEFNVTLRITKSNLTSQLSVVLLVKSDELDWYQQGIQFASGQARGILFEVREGVPS